MVRCGLVKILYPYVVPWFGSGTTVLTDEINCYHGWRHSTILVIYLIIWEPCIIQKLFVLDHMKWFFPSHVWSSEEPGNRLVSCYMSEINVSLGRSNICSRKEFQDFVNLGELSTVVHNSLGLSTQCTFIKLKVWEGKRTTLGQSFGSSDLIDETTRTGPTLMWNKW